MKDSDARLQQLISQRQEVRTVYSAACYALEQLEAKLDEAIANRDPFQGRLTGIRIQKLAAKRNLERGREIQREKHAELQAKIRTEVSIRRELRGKAHQAWLESDHVLARQLADEVQLCGDTIRSIERQQQELRDNTDDLHDALNLIAADEREAVADLARADAVVKRLEFEVSRAKVHVAEAKAAKARIDAAYSRRVQKVRRLGERFRASWPDIARAAGVPEAFAHDVKISFNDEGRMSIFFGGEGRPGGPGHAHYGYDLNGELEYVREIGQPHGPQNYIRRPTKALSA